MDSEIENDLSRLGTYFKNNFVQGIDEIRLKYEAKLSFKTFNVEALERDQLTQMGIIEDIIERVRSASFGPSNKEQQGNFCVIFYCCPNSQFIRPTSSM